MALIKMVGLLLGLTVPSGGQSISDCGAAGDHLSNVKVSLTPDPIEKSKSFTVSMSGTLDEDLASGTILTDLDVKALGVIDQKVQANVDYVFSPAFAAKGDVSFVLGPMSLPKLLPGSVVLKGKVQIVNQKNESVACINLNFDVPLLEESTTLAAASTDIDDPVPLQTCTKDSDHMKQFAVATDASTGVTTVAGTLDEDVSSISAQVDLKVHISFFPIPVKLNIPIAVLPGLKKGPLKWTFSNKPHSDLANSGSPVKVTGTISVDDKAGEEIVCFNANAGDELAKVAALVV